jgi:outer membrane protein OmpA-like peptidoglycan-associated protein
MRIARWIAVGTLVLASRLPAQDRGAVELGGFYRYTWFPTVYDPRGTEDDVDGGGARLGLFFARNWSVELNGSYAVTELENNQFHEAYLDYLPLRLQLFYNAPLGSRFTWLIGGGATLTHLHNAINETDFGFGAATGFRYRISGPWHLRVDGTWDVMPSGFGNQSNTYWGAQAGISYIFGGNRCDPSRNVLAITPSSATLDPGQTRTFSALATNCGKPDVVRYRLNGPGELDSLTGLYTATTPGSAQVIARSQHAQLTSIANVTVRRPAAPPPAAAPPPPPPAAAPPPPPAAAPPPPPAAPPPAAYRFEMQVVHFRFNRSDLTAGARDTVAAIAQILRDHPDVKVRLVGHTDSIAGNGWYNIRLGMSRAETVRKQLIADGIDGARLVSESRSDTDPVADNGTPEGRALNRRVEVVQSNR